MPRIVCFALVMCWLGSTACSYPRPDEVGAVDREVRVIARGLWQGGGALLLRLEAEGIEEALLSFDASGAQAFATRVPIGSSYGVTVVTAPVAHTCEPDAARSGVVGEVDLQIVVACAGPAVELGLRGTRELDLDRTFDTHAIELPVLSQHVAVFVGGAITAAAVDGTPLTPGCGLRLRANRRELGAAGVRQGEQPERG